MAIAKFYSGTKQQLDAKSIENGAVYITTDTEEFLVDLDNKRIPLTDIESISNQEAIDIIDSLPWNSDIVTDEDYNAVKELIEQVQIQLAETKSATDSATSAKIAVEELAQNLTDRVNAGEFNGKDGQVLLTECDLGFFYMYIDQFDGCLYLVVNEQDSFPPISMDDEGNIWYTIGEERDSSDGN